jgi:hypothetical protein
LCNQSERSAKAYYILKPKEGGTRMTKIKLTDEEKHNAYTILYEFIEDQDDRLPREEVDKLLAMFTYIVYR